MDKDELKGKGHEAMGSTKEKIGDMRDDPEMESEGSAEKNKGKAPGLMGKVKDEAGHLKDKVTGH